MEQTRREFLRKSLKVGAVGASVAVTSTLMAKTSDNLAADGNGVVVGKSSKKEVLYKPTKEWEYYYKIAY